MLKITRYSRAVSYLEKKPRSVKKLKIELKKTGYKIKILEITRIIFFILLYSSIISGIFSTVMPEFQPVLKQILKLSGIIGSTFCLIIIGITSRYIALYTIDLQLITSNIISLRKNART